VLARTHGVSLGKVTGDELSTPRASGIRPAASFGDLHVWQHLVRMKLARRSAAEMKRPRGRPETKRKCTAGNAPAPQRRVLDVVVVEPNEWWLATIAR
jgi:hypothetical protein